MLSLHDSYSKPLYELPLALPNGLDEFLLYLEYFNQELPAPLSSFVYDLSQILQINVTAGLMHHLAAIFAIFFGTSQCTLAFKARA